MPKNKVKLLLNLCLIAAAAIPRGGDIIVNRSKAATRRPQFLITAKGAERRGLRAMSTHLVAGEPENGPVDAHGIQAYLHRPRRPGLEYGSGHLGGGEDGGVKIVAAGQTRSYRLVEHLRFKAH
jgi:hypothetical protein